MRVQGLVSNSPEMRHRRSRLEAEESALRPDSNPQARDHISTTSGSCAGQELFVEAGRQGSRYLGRIT
ncbi:hypothetical protein MTO96_041267 [Rhipicephalus appendiculatus]